MAVGRFQTWRGGVDTAGFPIKQLDADVDQPRYDSQKFKILFAVGSTVGESKLSCDHSDASATRRPLKRVSWAVFGPEHQLFVHQEDQSGSPKKKRTSRIS